MHIPLFQRVMLVPWGRNLSDCSRTVLQPNTAPKITKQAHDHIKCNQKQSNSHEIVIIIWKLRCDNVIMESSSKTKAPKAAAYYRSSFFMVHFVSFRFSNVSIFTKRHQRSSREASRLSLVHQNPRKEIQIFYFTCIQISHYCLQLGRIFV